MSAPTATGPTAVAAAAIESALADLAPDLVDGARANLPRAQDVVARRLIGAAYRESVGTARWSGSRVRMSTMDGRVVSWRADRHAFGRIEVAEPVEADPARLLRRLAGPGDDVAAVAFELADAAANLALAYARRSALERDLIAQAELTGARDSFDLADGLDPDEQCTFFERLATEGHNLHPCGRTRLGWAPADVLAHDLESDGTELGFVGVRRDVHIGDDVGRSLVAEDRLDPSRYAITPVHAWQLDQVVRSRYADLVAQRILVPLADRLPVIPTAAVRTVLLPAGAQESVRYAKVSLDIQITSTRRTISVATTHNGPILSRLLTGLLGDSVIGGDRVLLLDEVTGSAMAAPTSTAQRERDLAAILRCGLSGRLEPGEVPVPGGALYAVSPVTGTTLVAELVDRYAQTRGLPVRAAALPFLQEYARLLLPPLFSLATRHGIAFEAHLQNCVPTFVAGVPHRLALRDLAGMRVRPDRLPAGVQLWPGSVIVAADDDEMRAKLAYTALQAHLGELVIRLGDSHDLAEPAAWAAVRTVLDEVYDTLRREPGRHRRAWADHAFFTAKTVPHKALLRMRLAAGRGGGDAYVPAENPLR